MNILYIAGIGPGGGEQMTGQVKKALEESQTIIGYPVYTDLVRESFPDKEYVTTPMRREAERVEMALKSASEGKITSLVCSGDPGVYGMAGLALEMGRRYPEVEIRVLPGVTAATGGAAVLGAPLMHDFAVISLSDLLTPWEKIEKRLKAAAEADFVICLYNPSSRKRKDYLEKACRIIGQFRSPETVCGLVRNIGREQQSARVLTLAQLTETETDMFTTVYIGNSSTFEEGGKMITPRGYQNV